MTDKRQISAVMKACIELEQGVASLYRHYSELFPEDRVFWSQLHVEEKKHATILRLALDSFSRRNVMPSDFVPKSLEGLREAGSRISELKEACRKQPPDRRQALQLAYELERAIGEEHYNRFMDKRPESNIESVFQQLNRNDKDHAQRIADYLNQLPESA